MKKHFFILLYGSLLPFLTAFSQSEATVAAEKEFVSADKELNRVYQELLAVLSKELSFEESTRAARVTKKSLIESQKLWVSFRKANAEFAAGALTEESGGFTAEYLMQCAEMTQKRTQELGQILTFLKPSSD